METVRANTRIQLRNILFCTDLSDAAANALPFAKNLASHFGAKLYALYVRNTGQYAHAAPRPAPVLADLPEGQAREQIKHSLAGHSGFEHDTLILEGELWPSVKVAILWSWEPGAGRVFPSSCSVLRQRIFSAVHLVLY